MPGCARHLPKQRQRQRQEQEQEQEQELHCRELVGRGGLAGPARKYIHVGLVSRHPWRSDGPANPPRPTLRYLTGIHGSGSRCPAYTFTLAFDLIFCLGFLRLPLLLLFIFFSTRVVARILSGDGWPGGAGPFERHGWRETSPTRVRVLCLRSTASQAPERTAASGWAGPRSGTCGRVPHRLATRLPPRPTAPPPPARGLSPFDQPHRASPGTTPHTTPAGTPASAPCPRSTPP